MKGILLAFLFLIVPLELHAKIQKDFLIKLKPGVEISSLESFALDGGNLEVIADRWLKLEVPTSRAESQNAESLMKQIQTLPEVDYVQPNYRLKLLEDYSVKNPRVRKIVQDLIEGRVVKALLPKPMLNGFFATFGDIDEDPPLPQPNVPQNSGIDPLIPNQWGMEASRAKDAWNMFKGSEKMIVAVIDTGVEYTHEDLIANIWHNSKEIAGNHKDDDGNGYVDDMIGWDFVQNDNKPYDIAADMQQLILVGGNPGHGTHCAGNVGARGDNGVGISGVSPNVKIMPLRFISEKGSGTTADAVKAINYAVKMGAKILSNSWGSEGEDPNENNKALKDAIKNAETHDVLFVAAAGNGHNGVGYDNDLDPAPSVPASYRFPNIVSVAALDQNDELATFSNYGTKSVHIGAPGVAIYSTTVGNHYSDKVIDSFITVMWDGTSMATPHVAGAAAMIWAMHPEFKYSDVKEKLLSSADKIPSLQYKIASEGKLNVLAALQ